MKIPVSVIVATKNEEGRIAKCLSFLGDFDEVVVLDSRSSDSTREIAAAGGARVVDFEWNGRYPKKRQWALDRLTIKHDRVFFVDADEYVTPGLAREIAALDWGSAGYFVRGQYVFEGKLLRFGLCNNKLALFDRRRVFFPEVDDLDVPGMGEIEGHYQPVPRSGFDRIGQLRNALVHDAYDSAEGWRARHERYAAWEAGMNEQCAWPGEISPRRKILKAIFRALPWRPGLAFIHCYIFKLGILDGGRGFRFAQSRAAYYRMISRASKSRAAPAAPSTPRFAGHK